MAINAKVIVLTLLKDMVNQNSKRSKTHLQRQEILISYEFYIGIKEGISFFLNTVVEAFKLEKIGAAYEITDMLCQINGFNGSKRQGDNLLVALHDDKFKQAFLDLFARNCNVFPFISYNHEKMVELDKLLYYCSAPENGLIDFASIMNSNIDATKETTWDSPIDMKIIGGFFLALGGAAIFAIGLTLLLAFPPITIATTALVAGLVAVGAGSIIAGAIVSGVGFFKHCKPTASQDIGSLEYPKRPVLV